MAAQAALTRTSSSVREIPLKQIKPGRMQPRADLKERELGELARSIRQHGVLQPIVVSPEEDGYEIIVGERRWRAARLAGLKTIPAIVRTIKEHERLSLALVENIQRVDLTPMEEARAYRRLMDEFGMSLKEIAAKVGKATTTVHNMMRLLKLPLEIQRGLEEGKITPKHARQILALQGLEQQRYLYQQIVKRKLSGASTEHLVHELKGTRARKIKRRVTQKNKPDAEMLALETRLEEVLGTRVRINPVGNGGQIIIDYYSREELQGLAEKLGAG
jgi:ParB family chromosome partitioning protein